jgi:hypothetical protein
MRLENQKESTRFRDNTWVPAFLRVLLTPYLDTRDRHSYGESGSVLDGQPTNWNLDEESMARSGASYEDLMFRRAMQWQNEEGFSPYFNPNKDYSKRKK